MRIAAVSCCALVAVAAAALAGRWVPAGVGATVDFAEYAGAARVLAGGGDMYDARSLLAEQLPAGWVGLRPGTDKQTPDAQMMWNPPWVAPLILPLARVGWGPGFAAWVTAQLLAVAASALLLWRSFGGPPSRTAAALALALAFPPSIFLLKLGQISGLCLLGLAGFLAALRAGRPAVAGAALALTAVKPHLLVTFAAVLAADALIRPAPRRAVVVGVLILAACSLVPVAYRGGVWGEYVAATRLPTDEFHVSTGDWNVPILAGKLARLAGESVAVQFAPSALATLAWLGVWWRRRHDWDWTEVMPALVLTCLLTTGYGAWGFDLVLLLVPLAWAGTRLARAGGRPALYGVAAYLFGCAAICLSNVPVVLWTPAAALFTLAAWLVTRPGTSRAPACA